MHTGRGSPWRRSPSRGSSGLFPCGIARARFPPPPCQVLPLPYGQQSHSSAAAPPQSYNSCALRPLLQGALFSSRHSTARPAAVHAQEGQGSLHRTPSTMATHQSQRRWPTAVVPAAHSACWPCAGSSRSPCEQMVPAGPAAGPAACSSSISRLAAFQDCQLLAAPRSRAGAWHGMADASLMQRLPAGPPAAARRLVAQAPAGQALAALAACAAERGALHRGRTSRPSSSAAAAAPAVHVPCLRGASRTGSTETRCDKIYITCHNM